MANFKKIGGAFFRESDNGELFAVSERETLQGLKAGQLSYNSIENTRGLKFAGNIDTAGDKKTTTKDLSFATDPRKEVTPTSEKPFDIKSTMNDLLKKSLISFQGVSNFAELEERKQALLKKQMLSDPGKYAPGGDVSSLGASGASDALKNVGSEFEPSIRALELQINQAKQGDNDALNNLIKLISIGKDIGIFGEEEYQSAIGKEYSDYVADERARGNKSPLSFNEYANMDANRKTKATTSGLTNAQFAKVTTIAQAYDKHPIVTNYNDVQNKAQSIKQIVDQGIGGPADLALVFEFMKSLDPTSVVRESEYKTAATSGNPFKALAAKMGGYTSKGQFLPQDVKDEFSRLSNIKLGVIQKQYNNYYDEQARKINKITGLNDGTDYLTNFGAVNFGNIESVKEEKIVNGVTYIKVEGGWIKKQ